MSRPTDAKHASDTPDGAGKRAMKHCTHWIGGHPWAGAAERRGDIYNPATGQVTGTVDFASAAVVDDAVAAAAKAFPGWRAASLARRANVLFAFRQLVRFRLPLTSREGRENVTPGTPGVELLWDPTGQPGR